MDRISLLHQAWRLLPADARRRWIRRAAAWLSPSIATTMPAAGCGIAVAGELSNATGLGEGARLISRALTKMNVPNWGVDIASPWQLDKIRMPSSAVEAIPRSAPLILHANPPTLPLVLWRLPRTVTRHRRIVGFWAWELQVVPDDWITAAKYVHQIWAPSRFTAAALQAVMPGRVRVVSYPMSIEPPQPSNMDRSSFGLPADAIVVLVSFNLASSMARKNPIGAIAAFRAAFGDRSDRILLLKITNPGHFPREFAQLVEAAKGSNIRLETRSFSAEDNHALTAAADIVLSLHRSEGFGLVPAEAMLLGKPVIATAWSGNMDFMDADSASLVRYQLVPVQDPRGTYQLANAVWAEPSIDDAVAHLRQLAGDETARHALGERGRAMAKARLGTASLAEAVQSLGVLT